MKLFDIIKCGSQCIGLDDIPKQAYKAFCFENDSCVMTFLNERGIKEVLQEGEILKIRYNPLLIKQNIFLVFEGDVYEIPYLLVKESANLTLIASYIHTVNGELKSIFENLIRYMFTKDFLYLNALVESKTAFDLSVFAVLNKAIHVNGFQTEYMKKAVDILNGEKTVNTYVYNEYVKRKAARENARSHIYTTVKESKKKKNVICIHLESISSETYYNHLYNFPVLNQLRQESLQLNNFFSSASSSCMSLTDLFFGNDFENDIFPVYDDMYLQDFYNKNMFAVLQGKGWDVLGIGYIEDFRSEEVNRFNLWNLENQKYEWKDTYKEFTGEIQRFIMDATKPFALHVWNLMPHIGYNDEDTYKGTSYLERMDVSYVSLDMTVEMIMETLREKDVLEDTLIICYGDHGDDKWTRSLNYGCTHITPPYLNVIKTPAFIYDARIGNGICNDLVSSVDIKNTALFLAGAEIEEEFPHGGINIFASKNDIVYSRSLLANQRLEATIKADWVIRLNKFSELEHKNKSFCAINEDYNILVSNYGVELFMHRSEPGNYNNLLHFFELDAEGNIVRFDNKGAWRGHFRSMLMVDDQIYHIIENYYLLRNALMERIKLKNEWIDKKAVEENNPFDMNLFRHTRDRGFIWD